MSKYIGATAVNLSTTSADVTGNATIGGNLTVQGTTITIDSANAQTVDLGDGDKIRLGDSNNLEIYANGGYSYIDEVGANNLNIRTNGANIGVYDTTNSQYMAKFTTAGAVDLYHNGAAKLATTSTGVAVTGSLGVGTSSPTGIHSLAKVLEISGGDGGDLIIGNNASTNIGAGAHVGAIAFKNIDSSTGSVPHYAGIRCESADTSGNMDLRFYTGIANLEADTPQVMIAQNGHLIIGSTSGAFNGDAKIVLSPNSDSFFINNGQTASFNRTSSDGAILGFYKDQSGVGSIATSGGRLHIGSTEGDDCFIGFGNSIVRPTNSAGSSRDANTDLGYTGMRFKDLYLSGGAYLGGTGSANKLDDYEFGTFSATWVGNGTSGPSSTMKYTKIGNTVHIFGNTNSTAPNPTGSIELSGLPFTPSEDSTGSILYRNVTALSGQHTLVAFIPSGTTNIQPYWSAQGAYSKLQSSQLNFSGSQDMYFGVTYMTA